MRLTRIDRLFHSIVVLGAALGGGCSSNVDKVDATSASGAGGGSGGEAGAGGSSGEGGAGGVGGAMADAGVIIDDASDCAYSAQFSCTFGEEKECQCDPNRPAGPEACEKTADFHCWEYEPQYVTCECIAGSPEKEEDCEEPLYFFCAYKDPPIGCQCIVPIA